MIVTLKNRISIGRILQGALDRPVQPGRADDNPGGRGYREEVHTVDQALTFTSGIAKATVAGKDQDVAAGDLVIIPAGTKQQFVNTGPTPLILYTTYSPAEHSPTTVHLTKEEGEEMEQAGKDEAPEWSQRNLKENKEAGLA